jgi:signal transduction histidine kinase
MLASSHQPEGVSGVSLQHPHGVEIDHPWGTRSRRRRPILASFVRWAATTHRLIRTWLKSGALSDLAIAVAALAGSLVVLRHGIGSTRSGSQLDLLGAVLATAAALPLVAWRRAPFLVVIVTAAVSTLASGLGYGLWIPFGPTAALYLLAASRNETDRWTPLMTAAVATLFVAYLGVIAVAQRALPLIEFLHTGLAWAVAWFAGERTRLLREELRERAWRAELDAERDRRLAIADERARIARDLHDSAGHAINVIAVRAGAARLRHEQDPTRSLVALEAIEEVARQTAEDVDEIVHALREDGSANVAQTAPPGLSSLDTLVAHHAQTGLDVAVRTIGNQPSLAKSVDQAVYRILQEALTNAARHGTGTADVELAFGETALDLTVGNPIPAAGKLRSAGGHGLIGMRERAVLLGGILEAGRMEGTFCVSAKVPYHGRSR